MAHRTQIRTEKSGPKRAPGSKARMHPPAMKPQRATVRGVQPSARLGAEVHKTRQDFAHPAAAKTRRKSSASAIIRTKRTYEPRSREDGERFLVERLWPRGMKKESLQMDAWLKDVAPSTALRQWFGHKPERWEEFRRRYRAELGKHPESWAPILEASRKGAVTLLYSAHDQERNGAVVLREYLEGKRLAVGG